MYYFNVCLLILTVMQSVDQMSKEPLTGALCGMCQYVRNVASLHINLAQHVPNS